MIDHPEGDDQDGAHERGADLFSRRATDNAEVVPPSAPRTHDGLWSTEVGEAVFEDPPSMPPSPAPAGAGPPPLHGSDVFSAEPVARDGDLLDEAVDEPPPSLSFGVRPDGPTATDSDGTVDPSLWRDLTPPAGGTSATPDWSVLDDDAPGAAGPPPAPPGGVGDDPNGFEAAVAGLDPAQRGRAEVPLVVAGALLLPGERVDGVLVGSMLGSTAALVVTGARVLIVNDRRWQPVVDLYRLDHRLVVRGRADRGVAAISIADEDRLSMVDGITDVDAAIALAERIRTAAGVG